MAIYWLLFAFPALMALAFPVRMPRETISTAQFVGFAAFLLFYTILAALREETGGDWLTYGEMFDDIDGDTLGFALGRTDPLFGALNWFSAQLGTGVYLVNGVAAWILALGCVRVARLTREPWLALVIAVPYLLIVVGLGYVRQGAAIGWILLAIAALHRGETGRTILYLAFAAGFHSSAAIVFPLFGYAMSGRRRLLALLLSGLGAAALLFIVVPRLQVFEAGYLVAEYDSSGAAVRVLMGIVPTLLLLARWSRFVAGERPRLIWLGMAVANLLALAALVLSPSSTAVDRIALYFSPIQVVALGEVRDLTAASDRMALVIRLACIGLAAAIQAIWLIFATHAEFWVPYRSVFRYF